jgi:hypothetical protein
VNRGREKKNTYPEQLPKRQENTNCGRKGPHRGRTKHVQTGFKEFFMAGHSGKRLK